MDIAVGLCVILGSFFLILFHTMHRHHQATLCRIRLLETQMRLTRWMQERSLSKDSPELALLREMLYRTDSLYDFLLETGVWTLSAVAYIMRDHASAEPLLPKINTLSDQQARKFFEEEYRRMYDGVYEYLVETSIFLMLAMMVRRIWRRQPSEGRSPAAALVLACARRITQSRSSDNSFACFFEEAIEFAARHALIQRKAANVA